jgi:S1-C subfamily serine protease
MTEPLPWPVQAPSLPDAPPTRHARPTVGLFLAAVLAVAGAAIVFSLVRDRATGAAAGGRGTGSGAVVIETNLAYQGAAAAGTGIVLSASGKILTNNHVIRGATTINVVVPGTGRTYKATVAGYDVSHDIAVLHVEGASGLKTAALGDSSTVTVGDAVTALGNAGGTGSLTRASGTVTRLDAAITANDDSGGSETLTGLIETNANVQPGDSGGPLLDADGRVVGVDTAASSTGGGYAAYSRTTAGYAVPIDTALEIVDQIESGDASSTVHVGGTAFLGVTLQTSPYGGAAIADVVSGGAADDAGLAPGDTITAIDGQSVSSPSDVSTALLAKHPGATVTVGYTSPDGTSATVTVTLASGPAQ